MSVSLTCPSCGARFRLAGVLPRTTRTFNCHQCGRRITLTVRVGGCKPQSEFAPQSPRPPVRSGSSARGPQGVHQKVSRTVFLAGCVVAGVL
jgi:DNA-directed RNA polymerase subunit RPC12/RpoP